MPRSRKGPRLWLRPARFGKDGKLTHAATWVILDGKQIATGCAEGETAEAEQALARHIESKHEPRRLRRIEHITVAEVLSIYDQDKGAGQANQRTYLSRMQRLNDWWGAKMLADVNGQTCRAYAESRGNRGGARRDLQDLQAAISHHLTQGLHREVVKVALPEPGHPRDRWLTRSEAARLLWAAWRYREAQKRHRGPEKGKTLPTSKRPLQHVARFEALSDFHIHLEWFTYSELIRDLVDELIYCVRGSHDEDAFTVRDIDEAVAYVREELASAE